MILEYEHLEEYFRKTLNFKFDPRFEKLELFYENGEKFTWFDMDFLCASLESENPEEEHLLKEWLKNYKVKKK